MKKPRLGGRGFGGIKDNSKGIEQCSQSTPIAPEKQPPDHEGAEFGLPPLPGDEHDEAEPQAFAARWVARRFDLPTHLAAVIAREAGLGGGR